MRTKKKGRIEIDKWMEAVHLIRDNATVSKYIIDKSDVPFDVGNTIMDVIQPTQVVHNSTQILSFLVMGLRLILY